MMNSARKYISQLLVYWNAFWFSERDLRPLAAMRILLVGTFAYLYIVRGLFNMHYFNGQWMVSREKALELIHPLTRPPFQWFFWPDAWAGSVHLVYVILLLLILLGLAVRPMIFLAWVLHIGFIHRNYSVVYGADMIGSIFLLYLSFTQCCDVWTLKKKLFKFKEKIKSTDALNSAFYRVMQIQISVIYAFTGFEKLKGGSWWDGTALWSVFGNPQLVTFDMTFMRMFPVLISVLTFTTIIYEIYWPAAVLSRARKPWLLAGLAFHIGIGFLLNIWAFSFVMLSTYFLFLNFDQIPQSFYKRLKLR
jgi:hypothetical protein